MLHVCVFVGGVYFYVCVGGAYFFTCEYYFLTSQIEKKRMVNFGVKKSYDLWQKTYQKTSRLCDVCWKNWITKTYTNRVAVSYQKLKVAKNLDNWNNVLNVLRSDVFLNIHLILKTVNMIEIWKYTSANE